MGAPIRHYTAMTPDGEVFTVNMERDFRYDPYRDFLVCAHCGWSPSLLTMEKIIDMAGDIWRRRTAPTGDFPSRRTSRSGKRG
ncbi:hypothetical protein [Streptomyces atratus]|uniref:hypothetical protein n=1 Tax=Streptomyces atratus TaxID=1893 RepID=UPI00225BB121|nr:hypothetical protein [Streptomyces atratus]MCX5344258.1 hypothetical protein [Streptomyces atratus]